MVIISFILVLILSVFIHELGHLIWARIFGVRVEKFYVFFRIKGLALFKWRPKWSETEFGIGLIPLGGYCIMTGLGIENATSKEALPLWDFRSKSTPKRMMILLGGVQNNLLLGIFLWLWLSFKFPTCEEEIDFYVFLQMLKYLTFAMSLFNLLPIPCLDGGRIMIEIIETIRKRPLCEDTKAYAYLAGLAILIVLFIADIVKSIIN